MSDKNVISVGDWFFTLFILAIPFVGVIMYLFWAFSGSTNINKKNFCRASLIWFLIAFIFAIIFFKY